MESSEFILNSCNNDGKIFKTLVNINAISHIEPMLSIYSAYTGNNNSRIHFYHGYIDVIEDVETLHKMIMQITNDNHSIKQLIN